MTITAASLYGGGPDWGRNLPKVTQVVGRGVGIQTHVIGLRL